MLTAAFAAVVSASLSGWLLAASSESSPPLWQYGAIGILAGVSIYAVRILWNRHIQAVDRERQLLIEDRDRERGRGDRLEAELRGQNVMIQDRLVPALTESARAAQEAMAMVRERH